jgi:hypothetical protein
MDKLIWTYTILLYINKKNNYYNGLYTKHIPIYPIM